MKLKSILFFLLLVPPVAMGQSKKKFEFVYTSKTGKYPSSYNSREKIYMMDMVVDPPQEIKIKLTKKEREQIDNKINEINFFSYPDVYHFEKEKKDILCSSRIPCSKYSMTVFMDGREKCVEWNNCFADGKSKNNMYEKLEELSSLIWKIIIIKKNYKKAKKPRAMYC